MTSEIRKKYLKSRMKMRKARIAKRRPERQLKKYKKLRKMSSITKKS